MKQILPDLLWLGHAGDARAFRQLFDAGIRAVIELAVEELPSQPPRELIYLRFPLTDGLGNDAKLLALTVRTVAAILQARLATLVCCGSGLSRAPAVAAAALALVQGDTPETWLGRITEHYTSDVSPGLWSEVLACLGTEHGPRA